MKPLQYSIVWAAVLAVASAPAATPPSARLTVRSYADLTNAITQIVSKVSPEEGEDPTEDLRDELGLSNCEALDTKRPWELAFWYGGSPSQMVLAAKLPTKDIKAFKAALDEDGALRSQGHEWTQLEGGVGLILFLREADSLSDDEKAALAAWKAEALQPPAHGLAELTLNLSDTVRDQAVGALAMVKMFASQAIAAQGSGANGGFNPAALSGLLDLYLDLVETMVKGLQEYKVALDVTAEALTAEGSMSAKPGTDLAHWLQKPDDAVTAQDLAFVDPDACFSFAGYMGKDPALLKIMGRLVRLPFAMRNVETNGATVKELMGMLEQMLPTAFAGSVDLKDGLSVAGACRFPRADAAEVYARMKQACTNASAFQNLVGKDKMYSAVSVAEKHEVINGVSVDRFSATVNTNSPFFDKAAQKEAFQKFFPGGKWELDYAVKDGRLLMASAGKMKDLLALAGGKSSAKRSVKLEEGTCLVGYVNLPGAFQQLAKVLPDVPSDAQETLSKLDTQGTAIEFSVSLDQTKRFRERVPLKCLEQLGRFSE
jgi:hypothetical protein